MGTRLVVVGPVPVTASEGIRAVVHKEDVWDVDGRIVTSTSHATNNLSRF